MHDFLFRTTGEDASAPDWEKRAGNATGLPFLESHMRMAYEQAGGIGF